MQPYVALVTPLANGGTLVMPLNTAAHPEHPIAPGGPPPHVEHPIPPGVWPNPPGGGSGGGSPPSIWPGVPTHPIVLPPTTPPDEKPPTGPVGVMEWHTVWTEEYGWAVIGVQTGDHVAPSGPKLGTTVKK